MKWGPEWREAMGIALMAGWLVSGAALAHADPAVQHVDHPDKVELKPPDIAGQINLVHLLVPEIDAWSSIKIHEESSGSDVRRYVFRNQGTRAVVLWKYHARRAANGQISFSPMEMTNLKPSAETKAILTFRPYQGRPCGEYRLVLVAVDYANWGDVPTQSRTKAGEKVGGMLRALVARMETERAAYK